MRVTSVDWFVLSAREVLVRVATDRGVEGWGDCTLETWPHAVVATLRPMADYLVGKDPRWISAHHEVFTRGGFYRGGPLMQSAAAGLDQALWDIKGKSLGVPVHELLGGRVRDSIRLYRHANAEDRLGDPATARSLARAGFSMIKCSPMHIGSWLDRPAVRAQVREQLKEMRAAVGDMCDLAVDLHGRYSKAEARYFLEVAAEVELAFVEEPLRPEAIAEVADLCRSITPIALGERLYAAPEFLEPLRAGVGIVQPDLSHAGGITECLKIASLADIFDAVIAPHCPLGPVALAACLQIDATTDNFSVQETVLSLEDPHDDERMRIIENREDFRAVDGAVAVPERPGLGVVVDEAVVRARADAAAQDLALGLWRSHSDGSYAEW